MSNLAPRQFWDLITKVSVKLVAGAGTAETVLKRLMPVPYIAEEVYCRLATIKTARAE